MWFQIKLALLACPILKSCMISDQIALHSVQLPLISQLLSAIGLLINYAWNRAWTMDETDDWWQNIDMDQFKIDIKINRQSIVKVFGMKDCH